jgi:hypothetical protein
MKKQTIIIFASIFLLAGACTKEKTTTAPTPVPTPALTSPYYFRGVIDGTTYNLIADIPQYIAFYTNEIGGYQVASAAMYPSIGLRFSWPLNDTVKESDLMGLVGKTLHYDDTLIRPELIFNKSATANFWYSKDASNALYYVKIANVTYLKKDTTLGYYVKTYVITGTCSGVMSDLAGTSSGTFTGGEFNFIISRRDF